MGELPRNYKKEGFIPLVVLLSIAIIFILGSAVFLKGNFIHPGPSKDEDRPVADNLTASQSAQTVSPTPSPSTSLPSSKTTPIPTLKPSPLTPSQARTVTAGGFAYEDRTDDGLFNSDDPKLPNMMISYLDSKHPEKAVTTFTNPDGSFYVSLNVEGNLVLKPQTYNNFRPKTDALQYDRSTNGIPIGFRSASAPVVSQSGIIEGDIFSDENHNKNRDAGEASLYFYKLYLLDSSGNYYNTVEGAQATDAGGHFKYVNLPLGGTFTLRLSNPTGDYTIETPEINIGLDNKKTEVKDLQIPVVRN